MSLVGTVRVKCPACGVERESKLVSSINTRSSPELKQQLLRGELNRHDCACGKRVQLASNVLYHDPDADYYCQVCPGDARAIETAAAVFRGSGATGTQRIVPSLNALIEKVKLLDAALDDWAIELLKVVLLASCGVSDLDRVLLFEARDGDLLRWVLFDEVGAPQALGSPLAAYEELRRERANARPKAADLQIDRAWAVDALRTMFAGSN
jgi:hypothetical protein